MLKRSATENIECNFSKRPWVEVCGKIPKWMKVTTNPANCKLSIWFTLAGDSISRVSVQACAVIRSFCVGTVSIIVANMSQVLILR